MNIFVLTRIEVKKLWNEFRLSLNEFQLIASYITFFITLALLYFGLYTFLFIASDIRDYFFNTPLFQRLDEVLIIIFHFCIFFNIIKGLFISNFSSKFNPSDLKLLFSSPICPRELYISKYLKNAFKRLIILIILFITTSPILCYLNLNLPKIFILFSIIALFLETTYVLSSLTFFFIHTIILPHIRVQSKWHILIIGSFIFLGFYLVFIDHSRILYKIIFEMMPSSVAARGIILGASSSKNLFLLFLYTAYLAIIYLALFAISFISSKNYYMIVVRAHETPWQLRFSFLKSHVPWGLSRERAPFLVIALKDLWLHIRAHGITFFIGILIDYSLLVIFAGLGSNILEIVPFIKNIYDLLIFILPFIIILILTTTSPSTDSFNKELGMIWFLKSSHFSLKNIVYGKYIYSLLISTLLGLPLFISLILFMKSGTQQWIMILLTLHIILIYNAIGILISANYSFISRETLERSFMAYFSQLIATSVITGGFVLLVFSDPIILYILCIIFTAISLTKYEHPIKFYIFDLMSMIYLIGIFSSIIFGGILISTTVIGSSMLNESFLNSYKFITLITTTSLSIILTVRICLKLATRVLVEREELM